MTRARSYTPPIVARGATVRDTTIGYLTRAGTRCTRYTITIPAGTRAVLVRNGMGDQWAVDDVPLLVRLTGNDHDPQYRYAWLPDSAMNEGE